MKFRYLSLLPVIMLTGEICLAQTNQPAAVEDFKPASTNIVGSGYPRIDSLRKAYFRIRAPEAQSVVVSLGNVALTKGEDGFWTGVTAPLDPGFHYYTLRINGVDVADPSSETFFGAGRMMSGIEVPEEGISFYEIKDVPHGDIRNRTYFPKTTGTWRRLNIYVPAGYDKDKKSKYPVLYIQHGGGEDERGWAVQGKTDIILDNLIAEGKAKPMLVVIPNGNVSRPGMNTGGYNDEAMAVFREELFGSIIPFIESKYRVKPGAANRAIAGLSMGGGQAFYTGLRNTDMFANVGVFSTGLFGGIARKPGTAFDPETVIPGILTNPESFNIRLKVFYISVGEQDPRIEPTRNLVQTFRDKGLKVEFASFPGSHEWQVWRKSLNDFTQRLFK